MNLNCFLTGSGTRAALRSHPPFRHGVHVYGVCRTPFTRRPYSSAPLRLHGIAPRAPRAFFWTLAALATAALGYASYDAYYDWRNLYPKEVRIPLKRGIAAQASGDRAKSAYHKRMAWETAVRLPPEAFSADPYLKITGIAVDLAGELEEDGKTQEAYGLYSEALDLLRSASGQARLSGPERLRGVSLAVKLGQLAGECGVSAEEEEGLHVWAVEEVLKLLMDIQAKSPAGDAAAQPIDFLNLKLPPWLTKTDISVPLQELGDFYTRVGKSEYAMPLYLQGISLLVVSDGGKQVPPEDMCQGAHLMNNVAELIIRGHPTAERQKYAEGWAQKALSVLQTARRNTKQPISVCEQALSVALFNAGVLREMAGDEERARAFFVSAMEQSQSSGLEEGVVVAKEALARLNAKQ
ncbi:hypothetical protein GGX14DRAFT_449543, partial [Mycena pura]